ncbi:hypothetical protein ACFFU9_07370 [Mariniflexile ostreae]|uniref:EF-hand domain-containing protein n=2 Tax=Mariniflexile ostreae TaxID=1520892 RepID=A0ABV5FB00_9FLAO
MGYAQKKLNEIKQKNPSLFDIGVQTGIASPTASFSDDVFADQGNFYELSGSYYFSKIGVGLSLGQLSNPTENKLKSSLDETGYPIQVTSEKWKTSYYGIGPSYKMGFNKFEAVAFARAGVLSVKPTRLKGDFVFREEAVSGTPAEAIAVFNYDAKETSQSGFYTAGVKFGYNIIPRLNLYITANYLSSFSEHITMERSSTDIRNFDFNQDGVIDRNEFAELQFGQIDYETSTTKTKLQTLNYGVGLTYHIGKASAGERPSLKANDLDSKITVPLNSGSIVFTNPLKKEKVQQEELIAVLPKNNSVFNDASELKNFTWKLLGRDIKNPQYIIELTKIGRNQTSKRMYVEHTSKTSLAAMQVFKDTKVSAGQYRWKVTETTTGTTSNVMFFTFTSCEIDFAISNETIECLGYEGNDRKYKICFDSTYSSTSGDLTFADISSGLSVYDQSYASLSYTLTSPNPTLVTQIGASSSTVSYCFEVTVPPSVTAIGFGLQGDDLDPSPVLCQPGVSNNFDELPDCFCNECEDIELSFDNFNIELNGTSGNQFNFNGELNANVPIYGIEFQIQSYSYTSAPSACSEGVGSVEESGVILMPGTSINGSTALQLLNETVSGNPSSNNNATKAVKYTSTAPLTGGIPVNLTVGLPGPISGFDSSCCAMDYTVCVKVKVFYDESNCKSCVFTHCFNFNNQ